ncbi:MAG: hypothetical protein FD155_3275 [Bacteroidetes bacterium]|nr:MAG: hypothetical protein FD155_3275 [Bacteroidota bacterium]
MNHSFEINHEKKYIHYRHSGTIERQDVRRAWEQLILMPEFSRENYNLISDYRDAKFAFTTKDIPIVDSFLISLKDILKDKRNAVIVDGPNETLFSLMYETTASKKLDFHIKTFTTLESAINFLL